MVPHVVLCTARGSFNSFHSFKHQSREDSPPRQSSQAQQPAAPPSARPSSTSEDLQLARRSWSCPRLLPAPTSQPALSWGSRYSSAAAMPPECSATMAYCRSAAERLQSVQELGCGCGSLQLADDGRHCASYKVGCLDSHSRCQASHSTACPHRKSSLARYSSTCTGE